MNTATGVIQKVPGWGWGLIIAGGLYWYIFVRKTGEDIKDEARKNDENLADKSQLETLAQRGIKPRWTKGEYYELANSIYSAMKGGGTDELAVMRVIYRVRNEADWIMLKQYFGVRDGSDLVQWLRSELSAGYLNDINKSFRKVGVNTTV